MHLVLSVWSNRQPRWWRPPPNVDQSAGQTSSERAGTQKSHSAAQALSVGRCLSGWVQAMLYLGYLCVPGSAHLLSPGVKILEIVGIPSKCWSPCRANLSWKHWHTNDPQSCPGLGCKQKPGGLCHEQCYTRISLSTWCCLSGQSGSKDGGQGFYLLLLFMFIFAHVSAGDCAWIIFHGG